MLTWATELEEAARKYRALGFNLTAEERHSLGSSNHLAVFDPDYLELLSPGSGGRPDLAGYPVGLNGLVFALEEAEALHEDLRARGVPVQPVQHFSRTVDLPDGRKSEARFNVIRLEPRAIFDGQSVFLRAPYARTDLAPGVASSPERITRARAHCLFGA